MLPIGHTDKVNMGKFSPDGRMAVTVSNDKSIKLWDVATGVLLANMDNHKGAVYTARV
ncbi:MAG TPA: hypothetical protein VMY77_03985 [Chitinophagaceae bacterium]|nr:hypothetical protein [Chitinophagaceae bacterium]